MDDLRERKVLGQLRPSNTTAASIYSPDTGVYGFPDLICVCNTTAGAVTFRIFLDYDGTTYDESTALFYDNPLAANKTIFIDIPKDIPMNGASNLAVRTSSNNAITFTVFGSEKRN